MVTEGIELIISPRLTCVFIEKEGFQHHGIGDIECLREIHGVDTSTSLTHLYFVVRIDQKIECELGSDERDRRHRALTYILDIMWDQGVEAANQYLTSQGLQILTI